MKHGDFPQLCKRLPEGMFDQLPVRYSSHQVPRLQYSRRQTWHRTRLFGETKTSPTRLLMSNFKTYPPVMTNIANWNMAIEIVDLSIETWWFSTAMLVYQRVINNQQPTDFGEFRRQICQWGVMVSDPPWIGGEGLSTYPTEHLLIPQKTATYKGDLRSVKNNKPQVLWKTRHQCSTGIEKIHQRLRIAPKCLLKLAKEEHLSGHIMSTVQLNLRLRKNGAPCFTSHLSCGFLWK